MRHLALLGLLVLAAPAPAQGLPDPCFNLERRTFQGASWFQFNWNNLHTRLWQHFEFVPWGGGIALLTIHQHDQTSATWDYTRTWIGPGDGCPAADIRLHAMWWDDRVGLPQPGDTMRLLGVEGPTIDLYRNQVGLWFGNLPLRPTLQVVDPWVTRSNPYGYWSRRFRPNYWAVLIAPASGSW